MTSNGLLVSVAVLRKLRTEIHQEIEKIGGGPLGDFDAKLRESPELLDALAIFGPEGLREVLGVAKITIVINKDQPKG